MDNPALQDCQENNGFGDMMDEDVMNNVSVRLKLSLTVWDFTLPVTPSLPAVFGVSWQYSFFTMFHFHFCAATHNQNRILEFMIELSYQCLVAATNNSHLSCGHMDVFSFDYMLYI